MLLLLLLLVVVGDIVILIHRGAIITIANISNYCYNYYY